MQRIMTAEQAFNYSMNMHPILYSSKSIELSKFKFFDHMFNVIGNGYHTLEDVIENHIINSNNELLTESYPEKYISAQPLFMVYKEHQMIGNHKSPKNGTEITGLYTQEEVAGMPESYSTIQINKKYKFVDEKEFSPYPNFSKKYSMVWQMDMSKLDKSWTEYAIWYYEKAKEFFNGDNVSDYHGAYPKNEKEISRLISDYNKAFERYKTEDMTESDFNKAISEAYELEYYGDTDEFIQRRWKNELHRILKFIDETLSKFKS